MIRTAITVLVVILLAVGYFFVNPEEAAIARLDWVDNSSNETGFEIERQLPGSSIWSLLAATVMDTTSYTDALSLIGMCYRVRAFNAAGFSGYTNVACVEQGQAPTDLTITPGENLDVRVATAGVAVSIKRMNQKRWTRQVEIRIGPDVRMELNGQIVP